jgi:hypothetical protein
VRSNHVKVLDWIFYGYDLPTGKEEIYLIPNIQTNVSLTEAGSTTIVSNSIGKEKF